MIAPEKLGFFIFLVPFLWSGDGGNSATPLWSSLIHDRKEEAKRSKERVTKNFIVIIITALQFLSDEGGAGLGAFQCLLFLTPVPLALWDPPHGQGSSQGDPHAQNSQLALPSASTPALLIYLLSLLRPPINQIIPHLAVFNKNYWIFWTSPKLLGRTSTVLDQLFLWLAVDLGSCVYLTIVHAGLHTCSRRQKV